jgi:exoribonuclease-2
VLITWLQAVAMKHNAWRKREGALEFQMPESVLKVADATIVEPEIDFKIINWGSLSRSMVAECMIAAGGVAGALGARERISLPFRAQPQPVLPEAAQLENIPEGLCRMMAVRSCMTASTTSCLPARHASLGLEAYVQVNFILYATGGESLPTVPRPLGALNTNLCMH